MAKTLLGIARPRDSSSGEVQVLVMVSGPVCVLLGWVARPPEAAAQHGTARRDTSSDLLYMTLVTPQDPHFVAPAGWADLTAAQQLKELDAGRWLSWRAWQDVFDPGSIYNLCCPEAAPPSEDG